MDYDESIGTYKLMIYELLNNVTCIRALKFIYGFLTTYIRLTEESKTILHAKYEEKK